MMFDPEPSDFFQCKKCGDCCKGYGGTFVSEDESKAIAEFIGEDPERFISGYCRISGGKPLLAQGPDGYCIFWDRLCAIHPVKPRMCREWPFIKSVLADIRNWEIMAQMCPGIKVNMPDDAIKTYLQKVLTTGYPHPMKRSI